MDVKDLLNEPWILDWSGDLREAVRSAALAMSCDAWWSRACGDFKEGKVSKEADFGLVGRGDGEGASYVRVRDISTAGLDVLDVGTVTKVETGVCESETFFSLPSLARIGTMTSLTLDPLALLKPKLRLPPPSHPLLLDGRVLRLAGELLREVGESGPFPFLMKAKLPRPEVSLVPMTNRKTNLTWDTSNGIERFLMRTG